MLVDDPLYGRLGSFTRSWTVVRNQPEGDPGCFTDHNGDRHAGTIALLDLLGNPFSWVNGVALPIDLSGLSELDHEHAGRYERSADLSAVFEERVRGPLYAYLPLDNGIDEERAVIPDSYWNDCQVTFSFLAEDGWQEFLLTTETPPYPRRALFPS